MAELHNALKSQSALSWRKENWKKLITTDAAKQPDEDERLPLHVAFMSNAPPDVIKLLLAAYPDAARHKDEFKRLPLHIAEEKGTSPENIELLLATYPDAINVKDPLKGLV